MKKLKTISIAVFVFICALGSSFSALENTNQPRIGYYDSYQSTKYVSSMAISVTCYSYVKNCLTYVDLISCSMTPDLGYIDDTNIKATGMSVSFRGRVNYSGNSQYVYETHRYG